jgi:hypothetical protein
LGCSATVCNTINVEFCCDTTFQINAGNDTTICNGGVAILTVTGCASTPVWYAITAEGLIPVGQGPIFDAIPQQSTCYVVICCDPVYPQCCDTDTVCVIVKPHPNLTWPTQYQTLCNNGGPITLNPADIFVIINNTPVPVTQTTGSGVFSGPGVIGNVFTPPGIGSYTICYTYTAPNGCSAVVCNTINVQFCCDTTFQINAGNDTTICSGAGVTLSVSGCNAMPSWYALGIEGPELIGTGEILPVTPQQSTCYLVVCCDPLYPQCCDTDTVCITVLPVPILQWPTWYPEICYGQGPFVLNPDDILVWVNNTWVPSTQAGGSGFFTGQGVFGNIFNPPAGNTSYLLTYTYTFANGCQTSVTNGITVLNCCDPTFQINAGPDITICQGQFTELSVSGCSGSANWYALTQEGPVFAGNGPVISAGPQQSTCYIVICCQQQNPACCDTDTVCVNVIPAIVVGPITGNHFIACLSATSSGSVYSIPSIANASYAWTLPQGMTINSGQGTNQITAIWTGPAIGAGISGTICVEVFTPCGIQIICRPIDLNVATPVRPNSISGPGRLCPGDVVTYSVAAVPRATSYQWAIPVGMTILSGAGTNIITVSVSAAYTGGQISVVASNACGSSPARIKALSLNLPPTPSPISGLFSGMCGAMGVQYSVPFVSGVTSWQWSITNGTIVTQNANSIMVNWNASFTSGTITVRAVNACGISSPRTLNVVGAPAQPGPVSGPLLVCTSSVQTYSVATVTGTSLYNWNSPVSVISGQGTKDLQVQFGSAVQTGLTFTVTASNACGSSIPRNHGPVAVTSCARENNTEGFNVYPNPNNGTFEVAFMSSVQEACRLQLIDVQGRIVMEQQVVTNGARSVWLVLKDKQSEGLYLLRLISKDGIHQQNIIIY